MKRIRFRHTVMPIRAMHSVEQSLDLRWRRLLDEQLPANALILDAGCGTGHLTNFLALRKRSPRRLAPIFL